MNFSCSCGKQQQKTVQKLNVKKRNAFQQVDFNPCLHFSPKDLQIMRFRTQQTKLCTVLHTIRQQIQTYSTPD